VLLGAGFALAVRVMMGNAGVPGDPRGAMRLGAPPMEAVRRPDITDVRAPAIERAAVEQLRTSGTATSSNAPPALASPEEGSLVYGVVMAESGDPIGPAAESARVEFTSRDGAASKARLEASGIYAAPNLHAGEWLMRLSIAGYLPMERRLLLDPHETAVRVDVVLQSALVLLVRGVTADGRSLADVVRATPALMRIDSGLCAVATMEPPGGFLPESPTGDYRRWGVGRYSDGLAMPPFGIGGQLPPDAIGRLEILAPLPAFASLVLRGEVLQTLRIEPGATSITFSTETDLVAAHSGGVRVRVIAAESGRSIAGARGSLNETNAFGNTDERVSDEDGLLAWDGELAGVQRLDIEVEGREQWRKRVRIPSGGVAELGTIALDFAAHVQGVVRDATGAPQVAQVAMLPSGPDGADGQSDMHWEQTDESGEFSFERLGRRDWEIRVGVDRWAARPVAISTRGGDVDGVVVIVDPGTEVRLVPRWPASESRELEIQSDDGFIAMRRRQLWGDWAQQTRRMLRGRYEARLFDKGNLVKTIPFEVGGEPLQLSLGP
jgi:hypothetical protein